MHGYGGPELARCNRYTGLVQDRLSKEKLSFSAGSVYAMKMFISVFLSLDSSGQPAVFKFFVECSRDTY